MTLLTQRVLQGLEAAGPVRFHNWSSGCQKFTAAARVRRVLRTLGCGWKLFRGGRTPEGRLYLVANSAAGLATTLLLVTIARKLNYRVYLHHHTYGYIDDCNRWMAAIDRRMGNRGVHVVHCEQMADDFRRCYATRCEFETIFPSVVSLAIQQPRTTSGSPFRLGLLSNLMIEKGVDLAIDTFAALDRAGKDVSLKLAGPILGRPAEERIENAVASYPGRVQHVGPVYGAVKAEFMNSIDAFLFPTRYKEESWGIVINEALAAGVPAITFDRGCTRTVIGERAGLIVPRGADYVAAAKDQIERWMDDADAYRTASRAAVEQAAYLEREGQTQLEEFAGRMFAPPANLPTGTRSDRGAPC